jgi:DNA-directed RNA polymerase specialized sigma24 family protein
MSSADAGEVLGIRPDALRALLHRAMQAMRASVELTEEVR